MYRASTLAFALIAALAAPHGMAQVPADAASTEAVNTPPGAGHTPPPSPKLIHSLITSARTDDAVLRCKKLMAPSGGHATDVAMRAACALGYIAHGDRIYALGSLPSALALWQRAKALHPPLGLDPAMDHRLNLLQTGASLPAFESAPTPTVEAPQTQARCPTCPLCPTSCPECPKLTAPPPCPKAPDTPTPLVETQAPGPRHGRTLGVGLGVGYDGLASIVVSWMHDEFLSIEASVGAVFPTLDARVRFYGMRSALTPVFGFGMLTPFGSVDHFDAGIEGGFPELYGHGAAAHLDLGLSYAPWPILDIYAGVSFLTTLDGEVEMLVFFPHWAVQTMLYF